MIKIFNIFYFIMVVTFFVKEIYSQTDTKLLAELDFIDFKNLTLVKQDFVFDGYLIIEVSQFKDSSIFIKEDKVYHCNIFCVRNINDIIFADKRFIFISGYFLFDKQNLRKKNMSLEIQKFFESRYNDVIYDTTKCDSMYNRLTTSLLSNDYFFNYLNEEGIGYFIFKASFRSALINCDLYYPKYQIINNEYIKSNRIGSLTNVLVILKRSKCLNLSKQNEDDVINYGFTLSNWYPDFNKP